MIVYINKGAHAANSKILYYFAFSCNWYRGYYGAPLIPQNLKPSFVHSDMAYLNCCNIPHELDPIHGNNNWEIFIPWFCMSISTSGLSKPLVSEDQFGTITVDLHDLPTKIRRGYKYLSRVWMNLLLYNLYLQRRFELVICPD